MRPETRSFVSVLRSPVTPFDRSKTKMGTVSKSPTFLATYGKCELRCNFLARKSAKFFTNTKVHISGKEKCKTHCQFQRH